MYSFETRIKALAVAGLMTASVAGSAVTAFATPAHTLEEGVPVEKNVQVAQGITLPEESSFSFTAKFKASSNENSARGGAPEYFTVKTDKFVNNSKLTDTVEIAAGEDFAVAVPGEYVYSLTEDQKTSVDSDGYGWTCSGSEYVLRVYVDNQHNVKYTILESNKYDLDAGAEDSYKLDKASFSNIYTKKGGSTTGDPSLVVDKTVVGEYGDLNKYFTFTVKFDTPDTDNRSADQKKFKMTFAGNDGGTGKGKMGYYKTTEGIELSEDKTYVFYLKNGASVSFDNLPAGTTYTLTEDAADGYTAKISAVQNGTEDAVGADVKVNTEANEDIEVENLLIGEGKNTATVTNTYKNITITGVVTHSAPFVIMVGALFVAVGGYVVLKKRIEE